MGRSARRSPAARVAVGALATVVATGLLGLGYAQANPQLAAPDLPANPPVAGPARPVERTQAAEPGRVADADDDDRDSQAADSQDADSQDADSEGPGRLRAAAPPPAPRSTPRRAAPPPEPGGPESSQQAGSKPTPQPTPPAAPAVVGGTPCTATARACVALGERLAWLLDDGKVVRGPVAIQHGDAQDPTPLGTFTVQWKAEQYTSREYLTQMPYSVFFADGGIAFHEGRHDTPSAGCVKLDHENAKAFFYYLQVGDEVQIH